MIAILPAAGKGTRMASVGSGPKELLEVGGKAVLEWVLEECRNAGTDEVIVVVSPDKPQVEGLLDEIPNVSIVVQERAEGLAPAVALAARLEPALVLLPDTIFFPSSPTPRLAKSLSQGSDIAIAVEQVSESEVSRYGIAEWSPETGRISRIIEKPRPDETMSRWAIAARFGLSARTLRFVQERSAAHDPQLGELYLPPLLNEAIQAGHTAFAVPLEPGVRRLDCGNPEGYRMACEVVDAGL